MPDIDPAKPDLGRYEITKNPADKGAFKTPTMRDVGLRAPYLHTGGEKTVRDVIVFYNKGGGFKNPNMDPMMIPLGLSKCEIDALVAFLETRDDEPQSRSGGRPTDSGIGITEVRRR